MYCCVCARATEGSPCAACGAEPCLDGRYRLIRPIGKGSAGTTWEAIRLADDARVAIKESVLRWEDADKSRELVEREARVLRQLHHPGVPPYVDHLRTHVGRTSSFWLVQGFVEGVDLQRGLADHRYVEDEVLGVLDALAEILAYLHRLSPPVVHRDLKPSNVLRGADGRIVLVDFGSVRDVVKGDLGGSTVAGTFGYMAPEQFAGDASPKSDLYALGALAVALLTREDPAKLQSVGRGLDWRGRTTVSRPAAALIDELLATDPARRPATADVVRERLRAMRRPTRPGDEGTIPLEQPAGTLPLSVEGPTLPPKRVVASRDHVDLFDPEEFHAPPVRRPQHIPVWRVAVVTAVGLPLLGTVGFGVVAASAGFVAALVYASISERTHPENVAACVRYVDTFNDATCMDGDLNPDDLCPFSLDHAPCDLAPYYACMAFAVRCNGDFLDLSGQANCAMPTCY